MKDSKIQICKQMLALFRKGLDGHIKETRVLSLETGRKEEFSGCLKKISWANLLNLCLHLFVGGQRDSTFARQCRFVRLFVEWGPATDLMQSRTTWFRLSPTG